MQPMDIVECRAERRAYRKRLGAEMWQSQIRKGSLALAVLAIVWDDALDANTIRDRLEDMAEIMVAEGVLYPILRRLRNERLIETQWVEVEVGHPRRYFRLTEAGRQYAMELSSRWAKFAGGMNRVLRSVPSAYSSATPC